VAPEQMHRIMPNDFVSALVSFTGNSSKNEQMLVLVHGKKTNNNSVRLEIAS